MINKTKVLVIDDDEDDYVIVRDLISEFKHGTYDLEWINNYEAAAAKIEACEHDIYLVDYRLGGRSGLDLLRLYKDVNNCDPFIILTGKGDINIDLDAMSLGASDYLVKSTLNPDILERVIRYSVEKARTTRQLLDQEAKYRALFQKSLDAIFITSKDQYFEDVNDSFIDLFGNQENINEYHVKDLFYSKDEYKLYEDKINRYGLVKDLKARLKGPKGNVIHVVISAIGIQNADDEIDGYQGIIRDITQLMNAEAELSRSENLAILGRFVRTIAHEVRNPLTNITLSLDQLKSEKDGDEDVEMYTSIAKRGTDRIEGLINQMLNSTKPTELSFAPGCLLEVVESALSITHDRFSLRKVALTTDLASPPEMMIDKEKLQMAFVNIIINAIEAMDKSDKAFDVKLYPQGKHWVVSFSDNGSGIDKEMLENLFDAFYTGKTKGMGLGLNTVRQVIKGHNGTIKVDSKLGVGTTFYIYLT